MNGYQITFFAQRDRRHHGRPPADWLVHAFCVRTAVEFGTLGEPDA